MARNARFQRYKERVRNGAQSLRDRLTRVRTCIAWLLGRISGFLVWLLSSAIVFRTWLSKATWNGVRKAGGLVQRHALLLVGIIVPILFILSLWKLPEWQVAGASPNTKRLELMDKARGTLAQIWAGVGIAVGLYFTWRRVAAAERTVQVATEGQITERFTRAIDQLGATDERGEKRLELRLGGIYALERIARDSKKDHWPIMEVLTAYVREHAAWKEESSPSPQDLPQDSEKPASEEDNSQQGFAIGIAQKWSLRKSERHGVDARSHLISLLTN